MTAHAQHPRGGVWCGYGKVGAYPVPPGDTVRQGWSVTDCIDCLQAGKLVKSHKYQCQDRIDELVDRGLTDDAVLDKYEHLLDGPTPTPMPRAGSPYRKPTPIDDAVRKGLEGYPLGPRAIATPRFTPSAPPLEAAADAWQAKQAALAADTGPLPWDEIWDEHPHPRDRRRM